MRASTPYVKQRFDFFNRLIFAGRLPAIPVLLSDASTFLGSCHSKIRPLPDGRKEHFDFQLRINARPDLPADVIDDVIIHEMIHYFIDYNGLADTSTHGRIFRALMESINCAHGRHISVTRRLEPDQKTQMVSSRQSWHVVARVSFTDGRVGIKVLPRVANKIIDFHRRASAASNVNSVILALTDNQFFNRFPNSASLRISMPDPRLIETNLQGALLVHIDGTSVKTSSDRYLSR